MAITFNGPTKTITLTAGTTALSVRGLWARWVDWLLTGDNSKYDLAMEQGGGDSIDPTAGTAVPIYVFMINGWRIRPQETHHTLMVSDGVLVVRGGGDPFVNTTGPYMVRVNYSQPVQAITVSTGGGGGASSGDIATAVRTELTPELGSIGLIKAKTDNLPTDPARELTVQEARDFAASR